MDTTIYAAVETTEGRQERLQSYYDLNFYNQKTDHWVKDISDEELEKAIEAELEKLQ